jgi:hypothetical protein
MIKFFRHIRQRMIKENRVSKYLLYAIGEIMLVVIGILIALQINNWNDGRLQRNEERKLREDLYSEFEQNLKVLEHDITRIERVQEAQKGFLGLIRSESYTTAGQNPDSLLKIAMGHPTWNPSLMVLDDLRNSGKLAVLDHQKIKQHLYDWNMFYTDYLEDIKMSEYVLQELYSYINDHGDLLLLDDESAYLFDGNTNHKMMMEQQFCNLFVHYKQFTEHRLRQFRQARMIIEEFLNETKNVD